MSTERKISPEYDNPHSGEMKTKENDHWLSQIIFTGKNENSKVEQNSPDWDGIIANEMGNTYNWDR